MKIQIGNQLLITGPLPRSRGVDFRTTKTGRQYAKFSVRAGSRKLEDGTYQDDWVNCIAWGDVADLCNPLQPGQAVLVAGTLKTNSYTGRDGEERTTHDLTVDFLLPSGSQFASGGNTARNTGGFEDIPDDDDGDLPFD